MLCKTCEYWYGVLTGPMENCFPEQCNFPGGEGVCLEMCAEEEEFHNAMYDQFDEVEHYDDPITGQIYPHPGDEDLPF